MKQRSFCSGLECLGWDVQDILYSHVEIYVITVELFVNTLEIMYSFNLTLQYLKKARSYSNVLNNLISMTKALIGSFFKKAMRLKVFSSVFS